MGFNDYIRPELMVLVPVLYFIDVGLKKVGLSAKWRPLTLGIIGIALAALYVMATNNISSVQERLMAVFAAITQGILVAGAGVWVTREE